MTSSYLSHKETGFFSKMMLDYLSENENLKPFYQYDVEIESFAKIIAAKQKNNICNRAVLADVLQKQYAHLAKNPLVEQNIQLLADEKTFVIVTGHQTNLFTGHLYFFYKIVSCINLCKQLKAFYPAYNFVPIYWMGSEDHDFEEINHVHLFRKTLTWQQQQKGATGRINTATLQSLFEELKPLLGDSENAKKLYDLLEAAYLKQENLGKATQYLVNELFGKYGLVILDQDSKILKSVFSEKIKEELLQQTAFEAVNQTNKALEKADYHQQAYIRNINYFYLTDTLRERIEFDGEDTYRILNTDLKFSQAEILAELEKYPERFSPNVILRPLYQQFVLPCLAYIGGGGETAYWLQLKAMFEAFEVPFPMLILRNSVLWIDKNATKKMKQIGLTKKDLFRNTEKLVVEYVQANSDFKLDLFAQKKQLKDTFEEILEKALQIDGGLRSSVVGEMTKLNKSIERLETKLLRAEKRKFETATQQIRNIKSRLFPNESLQERHDNFIPFYLKYGDGFAAHLIEYLEPLRKSFLILSEEN
ncbi:MAG: bacillithiol biosynthesis cysteine-adding enzyme BshC [Chitinophagales bacterium]